MIRLKSLILTTFALENYTHFTPLLVEMGKKYLAINKEIEQYFNLFAKFKYGKLRDIMNYVTINFQKVSIKFCKMLPNFQRSYINE